MGQLEKEVPSLTVPVGASINSIISRIEIPSSEIESNINAPAVILQEDAPVYFER